jgi:hypothetical protein
MSFYGEQLRLFICSLAEAIQRQNAPSPKEETYLSLVSCLSKKLLDQNYHPGADLSFYIRTSGRIDYVRLSGCRIMPSFRNGMLDVTFQGSPNTSIHWVTLGPHSRELPHIYIPFFPFFFQSTASYR